MSIPTHFQQQISRMTDEQLQKVHDTHKYTQFIIEREQIRRAHGEKHGQTHDDTPPPPYEDTGIKLEPR